MKVPIELLYRITFVHNNMSSLRRLFSVLSCANEIRTTSLYSIIYLKCTVLFRYDKHNQSVKTSTSDVYQEQTETKEKIEKKSDEMKGLEDALAKLGDDLKRVADTIEMTEGQIKKTTDELNDFIRRFREEHGHWTVKFLDFFRGHPDAMKEPSAIALDIKLKQLDSEKSSLRNEEWNIKTKQLDLQLQLANCKIRMGESLSMILLLQTYSKCICVHVMLLTCSSQ